MPSEQELIELRRQKREQLLALGDAYPARTSRTHEAAKAVALFERNEREGLEESRRAVTVAGRVTAIRDMGRAAFVDLRDGSGSIQLHLRRNVVGWSTSATSSRRAGGSFARATARSRSPSPAGEC